MKKDFVLNLRVRSAQLKKIKELGFKYIDCWELGFERILENERSELEKLDKKYHDLYIHVHTKLDNFGKKCEIELQELDSLLDWYKKQDRSIDNPSELDCNTVKLQMKKRCIETFTIEQVFDYWKNKELKTLSVDNKTLICDGKKSTVEKEGVLVGKNHL